MFGTRAAPSGASGRKDGRRDPPAEDDEGTTAQNEGTVFEVMPVFLLLVGFEVSLVAGSQYCGVRNWNVLLGLGVVRRFGGGLLFADERFGGRRRLANPMDIWGRSGQRRHDLEPVAWYGKPTEGGRKSEVLEGQHQGQERCMWTDLSS
jgi:hypothetical protein